jgi:hypothetical protein
MVGNMTLTNAGGTHMVDDGTRTVDGSTLTAGGGILMSDV